MSHSPSSFSSTFWGLLRPGFVVVLLLVLVIAIYTLVSENLTMSSHKHSDAPKCPYMWHGGSPSHKGSCWCSGVDKYCLCTPSLAIDAIIEYNPRQIHHPNVCDDCQILLVVRKDPPRELHAIPGGFVEIGESAESAVFREAKEETNLTLSTLEQFRLYSDPHRDARRHTVSMVFRSIVQDIRHAKSGDDAKSIQSVFLKDILSLKLAFDHKRILTDYLKTYHPSLVPAASLETADT